MLMYFLWFTACPGHNEHTGPVRLFFIFYARKVGVFQPKQITEYLLTKRSSKI